MGSKVDSDRATADERGMRIKGRACTRDAIETKRTFFSPLSWNYFRESVDDSFLNPFATLAERAAENVQEKNMVGLTLVC